MGKTKNKEKEIIRLLAQIPRNIENIEPRLEIFKMNIEKALACSDKKEGQFKLDRVIDEINGFSGRMNHIITKSEKNYNTCQPRIRDLSKLKDAEEKLFYNSEQLVLANKLKNNRNRGSHPDPYFMNTDILIDDDELKVLLKNANIKLDSLKVQFDIDEFSIRKEQDSQTRFRERQSEKVVAELKKERKLITPIAIVNR